MRTEIWSWQLRSGGKEEGRKEGRQEGRQEGRKGRQEGRKGRQEGRKENATLIKSRNRQLAGGEILYENNVQKILVEFPGIQRNSSRTLLDEGRRNEVPDV